MCFDVIGKFEKKRTQQMLDIYQDFYGQKRLPSSILIKQGLASDFSSMAEPLESEWTTFKFV